MGFENERDLIAAKQRIVDLEALVARLHLENEVLKSQHTTLQESSCSLEESRLVQQSRKQEAIAACASEDKLTTLQKTTSIESSATCATDIVSEVKEEAQVVLQSKQGWTEEGDQVIHLMSEFFQTHAATRPKIQKGDLSHYSRRHVALKIMYLGARFHGFASDATVQRTVESELFRALEKTKLVIGGRSEAKYTRCGRTDKGVSANGQVVALLLRSCHKQPNLVNMSKEEDRVAAAISSRAEESQFSQMRDDEEIDYVGVLNRALPPDIRILGWCYVPFDFHARFSCLSREYNYFFMNDGLDIEGRLGDTLTRREIQHALLENSREFANIEDYARAA